MSTTTFSSQPSSAREAATKSGIQHGQTCEVEVVVGATPAAPNDQGADQILHFCSSQIRVIKILFNGDNTKISDDCPVCVEGLKEIPTHSIIRTRGTITSNGSLKFTFDQKESVTRVPIPAQMINHEKNYPYGYEHGPRDVAIRLGCGGNVDLMFKLFGQLVDV